MCINVGLWIGYLLWNLLYVCWDLAEDLAFMLDVFFYRVMGVSWGLGIQFGNCVFVCWDMDWGSEIRFGCYAAAAGHCRGRGANSENGWICILENMSV